jgi:hypothetical protein
MSDDAGSTPRFDVEHPTREELLRYLDDDASPAAAARIADHVESCDECTSRLGDLSEPVAVGTTDAEPPSYDAKRMRRAVRRTLFSVAWRAAALLVVVLFVGQFLGALVIDPLVIGRGERTTRHVVASLDLPVMLRPGAEIHQFTSNPGVFRRTTEVQVERVVGGTVVALGSYETQLGPFGVRTPDSTLSPGSGPRLTGDPVDQSPIEFQPGRLGDGTAVTVELVWFDAVDREVAATLPDDHDDVVLTWVGFDVLDLPQEDLSNRLGYSTCAEIPAWVVERSFGGYGGSGFRALPDERHGPDHALEQLRRATDNLAATGWLDDEAILDGGPLEDLQATADWLHDNDPQVARAVVTGPTAAIADIVEAHDPDIAYLLEVDFDRGPPNPCR